MHPSDLTLAEPAPVGSRSATPKRTHVLRRQLRRTADRLRALFHAKPHDWEGLTFSQKVQWRCRHPDPKVDYACWVDKERAKALVAGLFPVPWTYAVVRDPRDIVALALPHTFVMKATNGWNMSLLVENGVVRGGNRSAKGAGRPSDPAYLHKVATKWRKKQKRLGTRVRLYGHAEFGVVFESYIWPVDYEVQLFLFAGRFRLALVLFRPFVFENVAHQIYDENWTLRDASDAQLGASLLRCAEVPRPPASLFEGLGRLCRAIDHVRVDFMVSEGRYYFSEFTFTHNGRRGPGFISGFDAQLGRYWPR
jgi:hypothetical protein